MNETQPKFNLIEGLKAAMKAQGVRVAHIKKNPSMHRAERLQIMLPLGRSMHIFIVDGKLLLSEGGEIYKADRYMELALPGSDPQAVVDLFTEMLQTQNKFLAKFQPLVWNEAHRLSREALK